MMQSCCFVHVMISFCMDQRNGQVVILPMYYYVHGCALCFMLDS